METETRIIYIEALFTRQEDKSSFLKCFYLVKIDRNLTSSMITIMPEVVNSFDLKANPFS